MQTKSAPRSISAMDVLVKLANLIPRIKTHIQLAGLIAAIATVIAIRSALPSAVNAQISAGFVGVTFLIFGQVFAAIGNFPQKDRTKLILGLFAIFCIFVLALVALTSLFVVHAVGSAYTEDELRVLDLKRQTLDLRGTWESSTDFGPPALLKVNARAPEIAKEMLLISDSNLDLPRRILKYEYGGYALVMAADTDTDPTKKVDFSNRALESLNNTKRLFRNIEGQSATDEEAKRIVRWIIDDKEEPRVDYLRAMATCITARAHDDPAGAIAVVEILKQIPTGFLATAPPKKSPVLKSCLDDASL